MPEVRIRELCTVIRSKQAGPYRLTLDIIFKTPEIYQRVKVSETLTKARIAELYCVPEDQITEFVFYDPGWAVKVTMIRPKVAGDPGDGDVYGCQQHAPLLGLRLELPSESVGPGRARRRRQAIGDSGARAGIWPRRRTARQMREIRAMSPGKLGHGCNPEEIAKGLALDPDFLAVDAGSTDIGAYYLGSGLPFYDPVNILKDLEPLLLGALSRKIPLIIGNVVGTGTNRQLDTGLALLKEVASKHGLHFTVALVRAEQDKSYLKRRLRERPIEPLGAKEPLTQADINHAAAIVAQMGVEPLIQALGTGAQVVLAGRSCDDALFAAIPVREGFDRGLALHMGKIVECGSMSCVPGDLHGSLFARLREDHFVLEPPLETRRCTVHSVASHTLYERSNPYLQPGPGGVNDLRGSRFEQVDERSVKVSGSRWIDDPVYKLRIEGARLTGYRSICVTGIRDPILIGCLDDVLCEANAEARKRFDPAQGAFQVIFRQYGRNGVMGSLEPEKKPVPLEIGLLLEVIADTQELADAVCMYVRGTVQHAYYPGILATAGNMAYPFSPFTLPAGPMYRFHIDHLLPVKDPLECFSIEVEELK